MSKYEIDEDGLSVLPGRSIAKRKYHATREFRWGSKVIHKGDLIPLEAIDSLRSNRLMADVIEWK